jgi:arabinofuranosyltransferase
LCSVFNAKAQRGNDAKSNLADGRNRQKLFLCLLTVAGLAALVWGWRLFWFMTDDAYIAFRYISNSQAGYGYTWNLPPFRPVEGYTSFLWVLLLDVVWRVSGYPPPESANIISLLFAIGTLLLGVYMVWRLPLRPDLARHRLWLLLFFLVGVLSNRTFLAWSSSGLETAMFNFFVVAWLCVALYAAAGTAGWMVGMMATAVLSALTRPDGLLFIAASLFLSGWTLLRLWWLGRFRWRYLLVWSPLLLTIIHFLWRKNKYGEWLPNTFAAKYVAPWPASGWRYLLSFVMEYALWFWLVLLLWAGVVYGRRLWRYRPSPSLFGDDVAPPRPVIQTVVIGALLAHFAYYTFIIGGDYFEYRVYSQLIIPLYLSFIWLLDASHVSSQVTAVYCLFFLFCSWLIPWTHWRVAESFATEPDRHNLQAYVADQFPTPVRPYFSMFDNLQIWLTDHYVARRHHQHKWFLEYQIALYPSREDGSRLDAAAYPVVVLGAVGVPAWMLPTTNIIDRHGLNDYVVARNPVVADEMRVMAHERHLPVGYAECFLPNVRVVPNKAVIIPRVLTPEMIVACETAVWPASKASHYAITTLNMDYQQTPVVDRYLWGGLPPEQLLWQFVPYAQASQTTNAAVLAAYPSFAGRGCIIVPPPEQLTAGSDYLFAFFDAQAPPGVDLAALFPWLTIPEAESSAPLPYLAHTAVAYATLHPQPTHAQSQSWANDLTFLGYDLPQTVYQPGETVNLTLYYRVDAPVDNSFSAFTHLLGTAFNPATGGPLWGQQDGNPCSDFYNMADWQPGSVIISKVIIPLATDTPPGAYELRTGFYNWVSSERVTLANSAADGISLGSIEVRE